MKAYARPMKPSFTAFAVEDDPFYRKLVVHALSLDADFEVQGFENAAALRKALGKTVPHLITLDFRLPDATGKELLDFLQKNYPSVEVIMISEQQDVATAIDLLHAGAYDYIVKDDELRNRLLQNLSRLKKQFELESRVKDLEQMLQAQSNQAVPFVGESKTLQPVKDLAHKAAQSHITVTITGETGTGKEVLAKFIHANSNRAHKPFVAINMASIPEQLMESELFGYDKGAFTGADTAKAGKFEEAHGGTLFLDEIAELGLPMQSKLLRAIQERKIVRLGSTKEISFDCRIITASHKDLKIEVKEKRFREDLYFRFFGISIDLPPLRDRGKDLFLLADFFAAQAVKDQGLQAVKFSKEAQQKMQQYQWPGNIRELKAVVELAVVLSGGNEIGENDIHLKHSDFLEDQLQQHKTLRQYEVAIVQHFLNQFDGDTKKTAQHLDIGQTTVYRMMKEMV